MRSDLEGLGPGGRRKDREMELPQGGKRDKDKEPGRGELRKGGDLSRPEKVRGAGLAVAPVGQPVSPPGGAACEQGARTPGSALEGLLL